MKKILVILFMTCLIQGSDVKVAVAANVSYAIGALTKAFNKSYPNINIQVILGSSGKLTAQIKHGAPYALFLSADMDFPELLYVQGLALNKPVIYAKGALAILSVKKRNYCAELFVLKDPDVKTIAIANPKTAPYGQATIEALRNAHLYKKLKKKFVYGESISQTVAYVTSAADIGVIAKSSLFSPSMTKYKEAIHWSDVDDTLYTPIDQGMVLLRKAEHNNEAKAFYNFMLSDEAKKILHDFGYSTS